MKLIKLELVNDNLEQLISALFKRLKAESPCSQRKLSELCSFISRGVSPKYDGESDYYVLGQTCVRNHLVLMSNARKLESKEYGDKRVRIWDIMVNSTGVGSLGRVAQVGFEHPKLVADSHITIVRPLEKYREYLGCQLVSMESEIENMAEGSTGQTELPRSRFSDIDIPIPSDESIEAFSKSVDPLVEQIYQNLNAIARLERLRDYLLPKLMSGEIDISTLELPTKYSFGGPLRYILLVGVLYILLVHHRIMKRSIDPDMAQDLLNLLDGHTFVYSSGGHSPSEFVRVYVLDRCCFL